MKKILLFTSLVLLAALTFAQQREWSIVSSYTIPGKASGLAADGQYIYFGIYGSGGDHFYRFDPVTEQYEIQFVNPDIEDCYGLTYDGQALWFVDQPSGSSNPALASKIDLSGTILETLALPDHYMSGIAYTTDGFWVGTYYPDPGTIYKVNAQGEILSQFVAPAAQPWDICVQDEFLWVVDYNENFIFKLDQSGNVVDGYDCEDIKPSGIVYDGQYLWYVDGQLSSESTLYKIDLGGSGTPLIQVHPTLYDYGNVTIGESATFTVNVTNMGTDDLIISGLDIPAWAPLSTSASFPVTLPPNESTTIAIVYSPLYFGELHTFIHLLSNDPIQPETAIEIFGFGLEDGPYVHFSSPSHNYGPVRLNAYTRWYLTIENRGDELLMIDAVESNDTHFIVDGSLSFPIIIPSRNVYQVGIWFHPLFSDDYNAEISVSCNDPLHPTRIAEVEGSGLFTVYPMGDQIWEYTIENGYDNSPKAIETIADVTGDGIPDVIVCSEDDYIRCFNGNSGPLADVMWEKPVQGGNVYHQSAIQVVDDINGDGCQEVVIGTAWGNQKVIAKSGKTGVTEWEFDTQTFGDGGWVYMIDVSQDYNNDGAPDVLAASGNNQDNTGAKRVFCLDIFTGDLIWQSYLGGAVFSVIGVDDITGDDIPDAIAGATNPGETQGFVYGINGANGAQLWNYETNGSSVWALLQLDDINGDGVREVVAGDFSGSYYLIDPVNGAVLHPGSVSGTILLRFEALDDVDADGYTDFIIAHSGTNAMAVSGFTGEMIWTLSLTDKCWNVAPVPDISGDQISDVIVGTLFQNNQIYFLDGVDGTEMMSVPLTSPVDALWITADVVGDNSWEVIAGGRNGELVCLSGGQTAGIGFNSPALPALELALTPNPVHQQTWIEFSLHAADRVYVSATGADGRIYPLVSGLTLTPGKQRIHWDGCDASGVSLPEGIYLITVHTADNQQTVKVVKY
ncbi:MAG: choice-of-anchor D domain-containing protein [Bacteroidales bacterium]|nr:choice-of-anchor D domain-containing protein [Bacteroidales bacterium]MDD3010206.1 choice-of-anchor D domain-containing protein [Bacteroidales bacterium]MDD3961407.1 choice-of-anchor D domain-containing protein [Bacteroidales bacterium]MDY0284857.1 choice-of-anchor D domain-containing protein [Bacteroidales bacterium]